MFSRKAGGRLYHAAGPLYAKLCCPMKVWTRGSRPTMQRVDADRSRGRLWTSSIGTQSSRKYVGATPLTHFHTITADFKMTRRRNGSQWRLRSVGETESRRRAPDTRRAAAFWTAWSRLICPSAAQVSIALHCSSPVDSRTFDRTKLNMYNPCDSVACTVAVACMFTRCDHRGDRSRDDRTV